MNRDTEPSPIVDPHLSVVTTDKRVRRQWSDDEKQQIVAESRVGYRQAQATARRHGISTSLLYKWRRDLEAASPPPPLPPPPPASPFMPVTVAADGPASGGEDGRIEIVLTNGRRVVVSGTLDPDRLARVLRVAEAP